MKRKRSSSVTSSTLMKVSCPVTKKQHNNYEEKCDEDDTSSSVTWFSERKAKLTDLEDDNRFFAWEAGYKAFKLPKNIKQWKYYSEILEKQGNYINIIEDNKAKLPVSCIESSHHVMNCMFNDDPVSDYVENSTDGTKLYAVFSKANGGAHHVIEESDLGFEAQIKSLKIADYAKAFPGDVNIGQSIMALKLGEVKIEEKGMTSMHVIVVVAKNPETGEIIVIERNAGRMSGTSPFADDRWLLKKYANPEAFREDMWVSNASYKPQKTNPFYLVKLTVDIPKVAEE